MSNKVIIPEYNINGTYPSNYLFIIDKIPNVVFSLKSFPFPGLTSTPAEVPYQNKNNKLPGDNLVYGELSLQVFLDEYFQTHYELYNWLYRNVTGANSNYSDIYSDGSLLYYNNSLKKLAMRLKIVNLQPVSIQEFDLDNISTEEASFSANLVYDYYEPEYLLIDT
jgi:hypothetical protein